MAIFPVLSDYVDEGGILDILLKHSLVLEM